VDHCKQTAWLLSLRLSALFGGDEPRSWQTQVRFDIKDAQGAKETLDAKKEQLPEARFWTASARWWCYSQKTQTL